MNSGKSSNDVVFRCANITLSEVSTMIVRGDKLYYTGGSTGLKKLRTGWDDSLSEIKCVMVWLRVRKKV